MINWCDGRYLWRVGFHLDSLSLVTLLSGMVEILDSFWVKDEQVLVFIVRSLDKTGVLFKKGALAATSVSKYRQPQQGMLAEAKPSAFQDLQEVC